MSVPAATKAILSTRVSTANNDDPGALCRRVCPDVGEIQIQCNQDSAFGLTPVRDRKILRSRQALIGDRVSVEPSAT